VGEVSGWRRPALSVTYSVTRGSREPRPPLANDGEKGSHGDRKRRGTFLQQHFGKAGSYYYWASRGVDERPVRADRIRKSVGAENTFPVDLFTYEAARDALRETVDKVWGYCERSGIRGRTVTLKVKFANFQIITRSRTGQMQVRTLGELEQLRNALLEPLFPVVRGIRLLGISMSSLAAEEAEQPEFSLPV